MARMNLFVFPHAGGNKHSYYLFKRYLPPDINLIYYELPGRGTRINESLVRNIHQLIDDIYAFVQDKLISPYAIFGHSLGSMLAYLITQRIIQQKKTIPKHLFLSGRGGPSMKENELRYNLPRKEFQEMLKSIGGMPEEILQDEDLMEFFDPILRADFEALEKYEYSPSDRKFNIPLSVFLGREDETTLDQALLWQHETELPIEITFYDGGHFFIFDNAEMICSSIASQLTFGL
jgi:surfactin synthase thioesterase subunit